MTYDLLMYIFTGLYLIQISVFLAGLRRTGTPQSTSTKPFVSVIIAARNEENNVPSCLKSVCTQTYPAANYEVLLVDDHSEDQTRARATEFAHQYPVVRVISASSEGSLRGKTNALATGIKQSKGEIVMITDADCVVPPTWIEETAKKYTPGVGIVGGMTLQRASKPFEGVQSLDWAYLLGIASAAVSWKNPLSTIGNNLSFRRKAYDDVGGYESIPFSVTEDYSLFQAIVKTGTWEYLYPLAPELLVESTPCPTWRDLFRQKHRWGKGGVDMKVSGFLIMAIGFAEHALILTGPFYGSVFAALTGWLLKAAGDYVFLHRVLTKVNRRSELKYFSYFQLYYLLYVLILPFMVLFGRKVLWKGRSY